MSARRSSSLSSMPIRTTCRATPSIVRKWNRSAPHRDRQGGRGRRRCGGRRQRRLFPEYSLRRLVAWRNPGFMASDEHLQEALAIADALIGTARDAAQRAQAYRWKAEQQVQRARLLRDDA